MSMDNFYPLGPQDVPVDLTRPSKTYKQHAWLAVASLALFVVLYIALAAWFVWTACRMLNEAVGGGSDAFVHFLIGGSAVFLAIFMLKALFFVKRGGAPDAVEITPAEQPRLFEFLHQLADEAGAPRPTRVYLSARVNAAVFYDLSILNLLFPSRKNLEIGLALVNVLTLSEIKAVLAHEFGHFAQRSMAIGSWVYIAQQIAAHIVAKRDALDKFLRAISNFDLRVAWIGWLLSLIVWSIRSLIDTLLRLVVLAQRALSRQMEFQADLVAVSLTGSDELVHALHKLHAADDAWGRTLNFAGAELKQGRIPHDLFEVQTRIIEKVGRILNDESFGKVPKCAAERAETHRVFKSSFAQPPQMWSTHPASADRENNAKRRYLAAPHDARSAWVLFDGVDGVKDKVAAYLLGETKAEPASSEQTFEALDDQYACLQYQPQFRGAYLGRPLTRHVVRPEALYEEIPPSLEMQQAFDALYSEQLADDLSKMRELSEELATLQALHDKVYQATGGRIVHRGREISRRELPAAIGEVAQEEAQVRQRVFAHDRQCRSVHLAAAAHLGKGWSEYLSGLISTLHYAEHTLADLRDAQGLLGNVVAVVTADGKVTSGELKRLISVANMLHAVLARIYDHKAEVVLDSALCGRLKVAAWADMLEEFKLSPAAKENINDWMRVIDGWVNSAASALGALGAAALEQLLLTEQEIAQLTRAQAAAENAPVPSRIPVEYATLLSGQERKRQKRLGLWSRFQTADGLVPAIARLLVAGAIVGAVLGFGRVAGTVSTVSVYNGLGLVTQVRVNQERVDLAPFSSATIEVDLVEGTTIESRAKDGRLIEQFQPQIGRHAQHYVYNVAGGSPLVEWSAAYGNASQHAPRFIGAPRWITSSADVFFDEPPQSVKTKDGGAIRWVLTGVGNRMPAEVLKLALNDEERKQIILAHTQWDRASAPHAGEWRMLAAE